jgi:hypothetical protein
MYSFSGHAMACMAEASSHQFVIAQFYIYIPGNYNNFIFVIIIACFLFFLMVRDHGYMKEV